MADFTLAPILPKIKETFINTPNIDLLVSMVLTLPALFIVISSPLIGYLTDKCGRKNVVMWSMAVFILSGTYGYFASSIYELLISRAIFGVAVSGVITAASALISDNYKENGLGKMMGLQSAFIGYSGILYIMLGGVLADFYWRNVFLVYLSPLILLLMFAVYIKEPEIKCELCGQNVSFNIKKYYKIYLAAFLNMAFFYMIPLLMPFHLKMIAPGISNTMTGTTICVEAFFYASISLFYKNIKNHLSYKNLFILPFIVVSLGFMTIAAYPGYWFSVAGLALIGIGIGIIVPNFRVWIGEISDFSVTGTAFGGFTTSAYLGQVVSPLLINAISGSFSTAGIIMLILAFSSGLLTRPQARPR